MEYLNEKLTSATGEAVSSVNNKRRKQHEKNNVAGNEREENQQGEVKSARTNIAELGIASSPFGGETTITPRPPPIGFNIPPNAVNQNGQQSLSGSPIKPSDSELSLYQGDTWMRLWFQRLMILSLLRLLLFIRKIYEDYYALKTYGVQPDKQNHYKGAAATLLLPTVVFTIYRVSRYLQLTIPSSRNLKPIDSVTKIEANYGKQTATVNTEGGEGQSSQALTATNLAAEDEDGLVTARETPTNLEDTFHDSKQSAPSSPAPSTAIVKDSPPVKESETEFKESVNIEKLGNLPDKETTRIAIGTSEQFLHGILFVFWQLKRQVDVLSYLVERSCLWRKPRLDEREQLERLGTSSDGLEWFQDFYAAFLAILIQVYSIALQWSSSSSSATVSDLNSPAKSLGSVAVLDSSSGHVAKTVGGTLSSVLGNQVKNTSDKDLLIMSELVVSSALVVSLLVAVRRRDDGILTLGLSMLGWGALFSARIIIISLAFVYLGWRIMIPLVLLHILAISAWIYKIAIDSHNNKPGESDESKWDTELELEAAPILSLPTAVKRQLKQPPITPTTNPTLTSQWSKLEHLVLASQILTLFAIPSLFYWPIMFNLKLHSRPFKYLVLVLSENFILIPVIYMLISSTATTSQLYLLGAVGGFSIFGFIFISLYVCCKPSLTEYFARADELSNEAQRSGIYFEFCSRVFKMPDLSKKSFARLRDQSEQVEEVEVK